MRPLEVQNVDNEAESTPVILTKETKDIRMATRRAFLNQAGEKPVYEVIESTKK